jgi:hypothetical protein
MSVPIPENRHFFPRSHRASGDGHQQVGGFSHCNARGFQAYCCFMKRALILLLLAGCTQQPSEPANTANDVASATEALPLNEAAPANNSQPAGNAVERTPLNPPAPGQPGGLPDDRTPISEGKIDPKSAQGAGQVLQSYFALLESDRTSQAGQLWSNSAEKAKFDARLAKYSEIHANIGKPGDLEGAAGSSYVDVPVQLYGRLKDGKEFHALGSMTLRRVNDVDGSTAEQRKWHIYKADFPA